MKEKKENVGLVERLEQLETCPELTLLVYSIMKGCQRIAGLASCPHAEDIIGDVMGSIIVNVNVGTQQEDAVLHQ